MFVYFINNAMWMCVLIFTECCTSTVINSEVFQSLDSTGNSVLLPLPAAVDTPEY